MLAYYKNLKEAIMDIYPNIGLEISMFKVVAPRMMILCSIME